MTKRLVKEPNQIEAVIFGYLIKQYNKVQTSKMNKFLYELGMDKIDVQGLKDIEERINSHEELNKLVKETISGEVDLGNLVKMGTDDMLPLEGINPLEIITPHVTDHYRNLRNNRAFNKQRREGAYFKILMEDYKDELVNELKDIDMNTLPVKEEGFEVKLQGSSTIVLLGDTHVGAVVENHPQIGAGYNYEILQERMGKVIDEVKYMVEAFNSDNIRIYFVGDAIENADMRNDQSFNSEFDTSEQIAKATRVIHDTIKHLEKIKPVKFGMVNGNHDRLTGTRNKKDKIYNDSAAYVILDTLIFFQEQGLLSNTEIVDNRTATHIFFDEVDGHSVVVTHGDHLKNGDKFKQIQEEGIDLGFSGHKHYIDMKQEDLAKVWFQGGSIMGSNTYSAENNFTRSAPSQSVIVVSEDLKGPLLYPIFLD